MRIDRESLFGVEGVDGWDAPWKVEAVISNEITYHPRVDQGMRALCVDCRNSRATHGDRCEADRWKRARRPS